MIYLASRSPRRAELLRQTGVEFLLHDIDIDESRLPTESATDYVCRIATSKARIAAAEIAAEQLAGWQESGVVLAADTTIALDDDIIGKPARVCGVRRRVRLAGFAHFDWPVLRPAMENL